ncbi:IPExxxVDY family protein [Pedobacter sp. BS3]|uniref:IPExxxVDY family protein n=1 Tax=Pedobacter sp. BS3 TaxID=2567937 RepID=UPI0011EF8D85|nr:IPExxxVDY family protein [Pedobacter sp. BS3]TZF82246.1 IPExxxVDY family protein [Pedobacter sp. BS3]
MNKLILKYEPDFDFILIAVTSSLKDYRLCFKINKQLNIKFHRIDELSLQFAKGAEPVYFTRYYYQPEQSETEFYLLNNKGTEGYLIPEMKTADFFILILNYIDDEDFDTFMNGLAAIPEVVAAVEVDPKKLKSKENLIF